MLPIASFCLAVVGIVGSTFAQGLVTGPPPAGVGCGDVNADGVDDLTVYDAIANAQRVVDGATGAFLPHLQRAGGGLYRGVGDQDGDGFDDLVHNLDGLGIATIVSGRDGSTLATITNFVGVVAGADVDGDGRSDLLLETANAQPEVRVVSSRTGAVLWQQASGTGFVVGFLTAIGDENGDGLDDVVFDVRTTGTLITTSTRLVRGPATIVPFANTWKPVGDVDGDGRVDAMQQISLFSAILVAGGSGATLWNQALVAPVVRALGDVDGDGHADFYISDLFAGIFPQVASGATFQALPGFVPGTPPLDLPFSLGDIDGDGRQELGLLNSTQQWIDAAVPLASRMVRRGTPGTTNDGRRPKLVARGHAGLGNTVFVDVRGALPNGVALLVYGASADVDLAPLGAPANRSYTTVDGGFLLAASTAGVAQFQATMPVSPSLLGASLSLQAAVLDPLANALGFVLSSALDVTTSN